MVDKVYCMSSYLALRYIADDDKDFFEGMRHQNIQLIPDAERILVSSADDIDFYIGKQIEEFVGKKKGILLSGGMDSAIVASYLTNCDAYTFRFLNGEFQKEELMRAEYYASKYKLKLHYVDISWDSITKHLDSVMQSKSAPVHSIEPQITQAALQAKEDGIELMLIGNGSDYVFGGMDGLLSQDWNFNDFIKRYIFTDPKEVLKEFKSIDYLFEPYRKGDKIDFMGFMDYYDVIESYSSYDNAFNVAQMPYFDPYVKLKMAKPLDLKRVRNGEPKYLIRELMSKKYPDIPVPTKLPMPRPVDEYFKNWAGPIRQEFKDNLDMSKFSGNQKWQMYCLERFLNLFDR